MCSHERVTWRVSRVLPEARRQLPKLLCGILSAVVTAAKRPASLNYHFRLHQAGENVEREREREREREKLAAVSRRVAPLRRLFRAR
jgi:hypothetical protein